MQRYNMASNEHEFESAPSRRNFDIDAYPKSDDSDIFNDMVAFQKGDEYLGAKQFTKTVAYGGHAIADAQTAELANYLVVEALKPKNIESMIKIGRKPQHRGLLELGEIYGEGVATQMIGFVQHNPDQAGPFGSQVRTSFLKLSEAKYKEQAITTSKDLITGSILATLTRQSKSRDPALHQPAQKLRHHIQPQTRFTDLIMRHSLKETAPLINRMETMAAAGALHIGTPASFQRIAYKLLSRAITFQAGQTEAPQPRNIQHLFNQLEPDPKRPRANFDEVIRLANGLRTKSGYGLDHYNLSEIDGAERHAVPLAIDRLMYAATIATPEYPTAERLAAVRSLGHTARMFAEQAVEYSRFDDDVPLTVDDMAVRYPTLQPAYHQALLKDIEAGESLLDVHYQVHILAK